MQSGIVLHNTAYMYWVGCHFRRVTGLESFPRGSVRLLAANPGDTGANTAEKLEGSSRGVDDNLLPSPPASLAHLYCCCTRISPIPVPSLSFTLKFSQEVCGTAVSFPHARRKTPACCGSW